MRKRASLRIPFVGGRYFSSDGKICCRRECGKRQVQIEKSPVALRKNLLTCAELPRRIRPCDAQPWSGASDCSLHKLRRGACDWRTKSAVATFGGTPSRCPGCHAERSEASQPPHGLPPVDGILRYAQNDRVAATTGFFASLRMTGKVLRMTSARFERVPPRRHLNRRPRLSC